MSNYISKSALIKHIYDEYHGGISEVQLAPYQVINMIDAQPTLDETEIIRKTFERIVERLKNRKADYEKDYKEYLDGEDLRKAMLLDVAIEIVKEEGGIE